MAREFEYDIAISFAGEDRILADRLANHLKNDGLKVFYDDFEQANLWGKDLTEYLDSVYRKKAQYCLMLISAAYKQKMWPTHEKRSALARALESEREYILPVKIDDTEIPGIKPTIGYLDSRKLGASQIVSLVIKKLDITRNQLDTKVIEKLISEKRSEILAAYHAIPTNQKHLYLNEIEKIISNGSVSDRCAALICLARVPNKRSSFHLKQALLDPSNMVRRRAIFFMGETHSKEFIPELSSLMNDRSPDVRAAARDAYKKIGGLRTDGHSN
jgi:HEAT repeat protein